MRQRALIDPVEPPRLAVRIQRLGARHVAILIGLHGGDVRVLP